MKPRAAIGAIAIFAIAAVTALYSSRPLQADFAAGARAYDSGDYDTAYGEWLALAEAGDAMAQTAIAGMHRFGEGRRVDLAAAAGWYRTAARQNNIVAQMNLGEMHRFGLGIGRDRALAWVWFTIAADGGGIWARDQLVSFEPVMTKPELSRAKILLKAQRTKINY